MKLLGMAIILGMSLVGCASVSEDVDSTVNALEETVELTSAEVLEKVVDGVEMIPMDMLVEMDSTYLLDVYGIDEELLMDYTILAPAMSGQITELAMVKVADQSNMEVITTLLEERLEFVKEQGAFYPSHVEIAQEGRVVTKGNFVFLVVDEAVADLVENFDVAL